MPNCSDSILFEHVEIQQFLVSEMTVMILTINLLILSWHCDLMSGVRKLFQLGQLGQVGRLLRAHILKVFNRTNQVFYSNNCFYFRQPRRLNKTRQSSEVQNLNFFFDIPSDQLKSGWMAGCSGWSRWSGRPWRWTVQKFKWQTGLLVWSDYSFNKLFIFLKSRKFVFFSFLQSQIFIPKKTVSARATPAWYLSNFLHNRILRPRILHW